MIRHEKVNKAFLLIGLVLLVLLSASKSTSERSRAATAALIAPFWERLTEFRFFFHSPLGYFSEESITSQNGLQLSSNEELVRIQLENKMLRNEISELKEILQREEFFGSQINGKDPEFEKTSLKHKKELKELLQLQVQAIPARVIYRSRLSWNSSLWINVGEADNQLLGYQVIAKNSPVVVGTSIVGVVDYVGQRQSRIRLITDSGLTPSVRAVRGSLQNRMIAQQMEALSEKMKKRQDLFSTEEDHSFLQKLKGYQELLNKNKESWFLAKGELQGSSKPLWRRQSQVLRGIGFNYDYPDEEGPARELRTGKPENGSKHVAPIPILKVNDLLVTNGMDGVFPPGLQVATVTKINPLKEGDYFYELEAKPTAGNLDELAIVFVMPPLGYDKNDKPPLLGD